MKLKGKKLPGQWLAVLVAYGLVLPAAGFLGMNMASSTTEPLNIEQTEENITEESTTEQGEVPENGTETEITEENMEEASFDVRYEALPEDQKQLLEDIRVAMAEEDMTQAAKLLDKKQEILAQLFYGTFEGERFLYDGSTISDEIDGVGLVFTMPEILFYGTFQDGKPQGACLALQFVNVDSPRYNFSGGVWKNGKMNGQGVTGYCYYENVPQGEYVWVEKKGQFVDDEMEGSISYEILGADNTVSHWDMNVSQGKIQIDERWTHLDAIGEYQLMSAGSVSHAYLIADDQVDQVLWMNLLSWE